MIFALYANGNLITKRASYRDCMLAAVNLQMADYDGLYDEYSLRQGVQIIDEELYTGDLQ